MTDTSIDPQTNLAALRAVDDLAHIRAQMADLKVREAELCDEIRACATERDTEQVSGATVDAKIETRRPRRIDISKLPAEIISDPEMYRRDPLIHVLIWPKPRAQLTESLPEVQSPLIHEQAAIGADQTDMSAQDQITDEPHDDLTNIFTTPDEAPAPTPEFASTSTPMPLDAEPDTNDGATVEDRIPLLLTKAIARITARAPLTITPNIEAPERTVNTPTVDTIERPAPRDLRPTAFAALQPMAGLNDEHVTAILAETDTPLSSAPMMSELDEAKALEAEADALLARINAGEDIGNVRLSGRSTHYSFDDNETNRFQGAAFASRRSASGDES
ncbi:hypothetical protein [Celeribacter marinus]|uniref:Uncharacterized protein n=1 Tax=Celeribacter marinus TaxID=1397108 RepID=A0A0P0ABZ3_9RHOB|nr:hypothetical protein [Celeribacter marinus]ALI56323.1 hypothetical protein IMCC12053_2376 [Celeribacter marinus]SFK46104.1 hypothetical protein SAMN05444421_104229 [Celeribacter marinus]